MENLNYFYGTNSKEEIEKLAILLKKVFKKEIDINYLDWLYNKNPNGKAISYNIENKNEIVGHYVVIPVELNINGIKCKSALSLNSAVNNDYRGKGFFKIMAEKTYEKAKELGVKYIIGVANIQSTKLFIRYFNFENLGQLNVKVGIGNLKKISQKKKLEFFWSPESLNWRIINPKNKYIIKDYMNKTEVYLKKFILLNIFLGEFDKGLILNLRQEVKSTSFKLYIGLGSYDWKKSFYVNLPNFLKPSPLNLILKNISSNEIINIKKDEIFFQLIDFDAF